MSGLAVLAVHQVAVASGLGTSLPAGITPSVIDGFAAGALLSGLCFLFAMAPRRIVRRLRPLLIADAKSSGRRVPTTPEVSSYAGELSPFLPATTLDPLADESAEVVISWLDREALVQYPGLASPGPASPSQPSSGRNRPMGLISDAPERRPEGKRSSGRHAAPPIGVGSRMVSKFALHPVAARQ